MTKKTNIEDFVSQFISKLPPGLKEFQKDIENHAKTMITHVAKKSDIITREEFDAQKKVLQKTRNMVENLEKKIDELEKAKKK